MNVNLICVLNRHDEWPQPKYYDTVSSRKMRTEMMHESI